MNEKLETIQKRSRIGAKVLSVLQTLVIVGAVLCLVGGCILIGLKDEINPEIRERVESGQISVYEIRTQEGFLAATFDFDERIAAGDYATAFAADCFFGAVMCIFVCIVLFQLGIIFKSLSSEGTPFSENVMKRLKISFIVVTVAALFASGLGLALVVGLFLWCIYAIFEYGILLQTQVDETL